MVSILSFFIKKRPKTTTAATTPSPDPSDRRPSTPLTSPSPPRASTSSRIARTKSNRVPTPPQPKTNQVVKKDHRASLDGYGLARRKAAAGATAVAMAPVTAAPPRITIDLPFEINSSGLSASATGKRAAHASLPAAYTVSLGLDAVGGTPTITAAERRVLDAQRYSPADVRKAWDWLGPEVKERGAETVGIMLPRRFEANKDKQRQLAVLFVLARRPELADKFPTIASTYPTPKKDDAADVWKSRLVQVAKDTENPVNIAETLKALLRRLAGSNRPIIDPSVYVRFVQQEHAASYPRNAYATMLLPHLADDVMGLLDAVFEVCNAIAMHAETNAMGAGRLCHLIGWWLLGKIPDGTTGWNALYDEYKLAGQRTEHLFYARIRWQSTQQKMPRRLVQLILSYPFGESSASFEHLPLPPTSTFTRRVLHVALGTDAGLPSGTDPVKVLGDAIIARLDDKVSASEWQVLRNKDGRTISLEELLAANSQTFLDEVCVAKGIELASPTMAPADLADEDSRYHPFASDGDRIITSNFSQYRRRSSSYGDIPHLEIGSSGSSTLETVTEDGSPQKQSDKPSALVRFGSARQLSPTKKSSPVWDDFATSGFGDSLGADVSLALTKPVASSRDGSASFSPPKKIIVKGAAPSTSLLVAAQDVIEVDDAFIHFVEDGQLDPVASTAWPRFALVELCAPIHINNNEVNWLLVTVKKRDIKHRISDDEPIPDIRAELTRSMSPSNESSISRLSSTFGFRDIANTFRRSSVYGGRSSHRMSFIHTSSAKSSSKGVESLSPVHERAGRMSAASDAPTEYTIGEIGEMVKIPSALELSQIANGTPRSATPVSAATLDAAKPVMASTASDWAYLAEGGAHIVFRYIGSEPELQGRALRLQKIAKKGAPDVAVRHAWSEKLLPMITPAHLLPDTTPIIIDEKWTRALVTPIEIVRQSSRRAEGSLLQIVDYSRPAQLIDNLTAPTTGQKVLALEIKPKWGFLPSASNLTPHESVLIKTRNCRFCLHQHYRGEYDEDGYCPIDLYSGDEKRVRRALDGLWKTWRESGGDKNNLRIFVDGNKVLPKDAHLVPTSGANLPSGSYALVEPLLTSSNVLATLKKLQSNLDPHDISSLAQDSALEHPNHKPFASELVPEPTIPELTEFVLMYKRGETNWTLRQREIAYALSAIFKDCSIIVRAVLRSTTEGYVLDNNNSTVKLIDTDLKPLAALGHWAELDDKLWRHWSKTQVETVVVIDSNKAKNLTIEPTANVVDISEDTQPPLTPITPISAIGDTMYAAAALGAGVAVAAGAATLAVPKSSPSKRTVELSESSTITDETPKAPLSPALSNSIPDMEDATEALARVVDPTATPEPEVESAVDAEVAPVVANDVETPKAPVEDAVAKEDDAAPAEDFVTVPAIAAGAAVAAAAVTVAAVVLATPEEASEPAASVPEPAQIEEAAPKEVNEEITEAKEDIVTPVEAASPVVETAVLDAAPVEIPAAVETAEVAAPADEIREVTEAVPTAPEVAPEATSSVLDAATEQLQETTTKKPAAIDLTLVDDVPTPLVSPVAAVRPEDAVDFEADPFAKAPVVLPRMESRTSLAASVAAAASPLPSIAPSIAPSGISSGVATPVAAFPSRPSTPAASPASLTAPPVERTPSRVRDRIKAIENTDKDHKPVIPVARGIGLGTPSAPADKAKRPVKKGSFAAFVRKASATFDRPGSDKAKGPSSPKDSKTPLPAAPKPSPVKPPPSAAPKEKAINPFGSLRNKKKMAATAGAAAIAATATVATATLSKEEKAAATAPEVAPEADKPEATTEAPVEKAVEAPVDAAEAPVEAPETAADVIDLSDDAPVAPVDVAQAEVCEASAEESTPEVAAEVVPVAAEVVHSTAEVVPVTATEESEALVESAPIEVESPTETEPEATAEAESPAEDAIRAVEAPVETVETTAEIAETTAEIVPDATAAAVETDAPVETVVALVREVPAVPEVTTLPIMQTAAGAVEAPVELSVVEASGSDIEIAPDVIETVAPVEAVPAPAEEASAPAEIPVETESVPEPVPESTPEAIAAEESVQAEAEAVDSTQTVDDAETSMETTEVATAVETAEPTAPVINTVAAESEFATPIDALPKETDTVPAEKSPRVIPAAILVTPYAEESVPPTASTASFASAMSPTTLEATVDEVNTIAEVSIPEEAEQAIPESAVLPREKTPELVPDAKVPVAAAAASSVVVGLGLGLAADEEPEEPVAAIAPPSVDIAPPTPLPVVPDQPEYFALPTSGAILEPKTLSFSAVTPEFASTSVFATPLDVMSHLGDVPETVEDANKAAAESSATVAADRNPVEADTSAQLAVEAEVIELADKAEPKTISRAASPTPGPPENVEMYQNAELPPIPLSKSAVGTILSSIPMAFEASADSRHDVALQSSAELDPTTFATALDTPSFSDAQRFEDAESDTVNLPELTAFTKRMAERRISIPEPGIDMSEEHRMSQHTFGGSVLAETYRTSAENYRSSVHTFGGTTSEAAWLNGIAGIKTYEKSRLSMDSMTVPEVTSAAIASTSSALSGSVLDEKIEEALEGVETKTTV